MNIPVVKHLFTTTYLNPYDEDNIIYDYPNGAVLVLCNQEDVICICAYSEYNASENYDDPAIKEEYLNDYFTSVPEEKRPEKATDFSIMVHTPIERTAFSLQNAIPFSKEQFYANFFFRIQILNSACAERFGHDVTHEHFKLIFYEYPGTEGGILYLGYTLDDDPDLSAIEAIMGTHLTMLSKSDYLARRNEYYEKSSHSHEHDDKNKPFNTESLFGEIQSWLFQTDYMDFLNAIKTRVKGQPNLNLVLINVYVYLRSLVKGKPYRSNILLTAPSGCGKTETFRAIRDYFKEAIPLLPVIQIDLSPFTESGYRGRNSHEIGDAIAIKETNGIAIVFLDEIDKKIIPSLSSPSSNANMAVQAELLTLLEGSVITGSSGKYLLDSTNTFFIGLGSFDEIRKRKALKASRPKIGFVNEEAVTSYEHYHDITTSDIIELGATYEFLGRFSLLVNYQKLSDTCILEIIGSITHELSRALQIEICLTEKMKAFLLQNANGKYGCRRLRSLIESAVYPKYSALLESKKAESILYIDEPVLEV